LPANVISTPWSRRAAGRDRQRIAQVRRLVGAGITGTKRFRKDLGLDA
jgi:hypothetical protein